MAKDPVCGMRVTPENAADKKTYMGKTFYFCSRKCSDEFMNFPDYHLATQFDKKISNSRNYYGISDVCLSIPSILNQNGIYRHLNLTLDQNEVGMLLESAGVLKEVLRQLDI